MRLIKCKMGGQFPWFAMTAGFLLFIVFLALGTWQMRRLKWKEELLSTIAERMISAPRSLSEIEDLYHRSGNVDYWPIRVTGRFLHKSEQHFFATYEGYAGFFVYTPLQMADSRIIFINRGFVPYERKEAEMRTQGQMIGEVTITGLARDPLYQKPSFFIPDNDLAKNIFYWKDLSAMTRGLTLNNTVKLVPFFIDADKSLNPGGLPIGGVTLIDLPNHHLQYAVTWYGLALALLGVTSIYVWQWCVEKDDLSEFRKTKPFW